MVGRGHWGCRERLNETSRIGKYRRKYGYLALDRPGFCEICRGTTKIAYDHDHITGKHRGWLCMKCNTALGLVGDSPLILQKMIDYLKG